MKNVFDFRKELIGEYAKFSTSFAKPSADDIAARLKEEYGSGRYWREPLIQINPNYEKDKTVDELAAAGVLTAECASEKFARELFGDEFVHTRAHPCADGIGFHRLTACGKFVNDADIEVAV